jgi:glycosyltransferase involved in cell wall biosynthesis
MSYYNFLVQSYPLISVITPVFNGERYIRETVDSVLKYAEGFPVEYIIVDDGSTDSTSQILQNYLSSVTILSQSNLGESAAVNHGFKHSRGEILLVVSADDPLFTSLIFSGVKDFFKENSSVVAWYPDWNLIDNYGKIVEVRKVPDYEDRLLIGEFQCLPGPGTLIRKTAAEKISGRDTRYKFKGDYDFWLRLSRVGELRHRSEVLAQWRMHDGSTSISQRGSEMALERIEVIQNFVSSNSIDVQLKKSAISHAYYFAARLVSFDRKVPGRRYLLKAIKVQKGWIPGSSVAIVFFILLAPISTIGWNFLRRYSILNFLRHKYSKHF